MPDKRKKMTLEPAGPGQWHLKDYQMIYNFAQKRGISFTKATRILQKLFQGGKTNVNDANNPATAEEVTSKRQHQTPSL
jgi:hypothetical protein